MDMDGNGGYRQSDKMGGARNKEHSTLHTLVDIELDC